MGSTPTTIYSNNYYHYWLYFLVINFLLFVIFVFVGVIVFVFVFVIVIVIVIIIVSIIIVIVVIIIIILIIIIIIIIMLLIRHMERWRNPATECFWMFLRCDGLKPRLEGSPLADVEHRRTCLAKQACFYNQWSSIWCWISSLSMTLCMLLSQEWVYHQSSSIFFMVFPLQTIQLLGYPHGHGNPYVLLRFYGQRCHDHPGGGALAMWSTTWSAKWWMNPVWCHVMASTVAWFVSPWSPLHVADSWQIVGLGELCQILGLILCGQTIPVQQEKQF